MMNINSKINTCILMFVLLLIFPVHSYSSDLDVLNNDWIEDLEKIFDSLSKKERNSTVLVHSKLNLQSGGTIRRDVFVPYKTIQESVMGLLNNDFFIVKEKNNLTSYNNENFPFMNNESLDDAIEKIIFHYSEKGKINPWIRRDDFLVYVSPLSRHAYHVISTESFNDIVDRDNDMEVKISGTFFQIALFINAPLVACLSLFCF